ncbi:hypothetical protein ABZ502_29935 [Streptomyces abikoensis]|uniref:hypothetical protein n=1 Tax=Streptomyces abikoensis TaxID=97398 RepID=UPI0033E8AA10
MSTDHYKEWQQLDVRQPGDVPTATPLLWQAERFSEAGMRLSSLRLPVDFPYEAERGTTGDALTQLALGESIRREVGHHRPGDIHQALQLGATWNQVAAALDITADAARAELRAHADGQRHLYTTFEERGEKPFGFTAEQHAAALALTELGDDEPAAGPAGVGG